VLRPPNGSLTELQAGLTWLRQSGTPLAATRERARERRDAAQKPLLQGLQPGSHERRLASSCEKLGRDLARATKFDRYVTSLVV
jgi:hypothetical protein